MPAADEKPAVAFFTIEPSEEPNWGTPTAIDLAQQGQILWQSKTNEPLVGGVLATAGGLVFTGEGNGDLSDSAAGAKLWSFNCGLRSTRRL